MGDVIASVQEAARITTWFSVATVVLTAVIWVAGGIAYYKWKERRHE